MRFKFQFWCVNHWEKLLGYMFWQEVRILIFEVKAKCLHCLCSRSCNITKALGFSGLKTQIFCGWKSQCMIYANIVHIIIMSFTTFFSRSKSTSLKSENVPIVSLKIRANSVLFQTKIFSMICFLFNKSMYWFQCAFYDNLTLFAKL